MDKPMILGANVEICGGSGAFILAAVAGAGGYLLVLFEGCGVSAVEGNAYWSAVA